MQKIQTCQHQPLGSSANTAAFKRYLSTAKLFLNCTRFTGYKKHKDGSRIFINPQLEFIPRSDSISASRYKFVDENRSGQTAIHTILKPFRILKEALLWKFGYNSFLIETGGIVVFVPRRQKRLLSYCCEHQTEILQIWQENALGLKDRNKREKDFGG